MERLAGAGGGFGDDSYEEEEEEYEDPEAEEEEEVVDDHEEDHEQESDIPLIRVAVLGSQGVGKTTVTRQLLTSEYLQNRGDVCLGKPYS